MKNLAKIIFATGLLVAAAITHAQYNTADTATAVDESFTIQAEETTPATSSVRPVPLQVKQITPEDRALMERRRAEAEQKRLEAMKLRNDAGITKPPVTATNTPVRAKLLEMKRDTEQMKTDARNRIATTASQIRDRLTNTNQGVAEQRAIGLRNNIRVMLGRFTAAILRLDTMAEKISNHIIRLEEAGRDTSDANSALTDAKTKIAEATESLANLKVALENVLETSNTKTAFEEIRRLSEDTKTKIKEAHSALVDVVNILKPGTRQEIELRQASSTVESEGN